MSLRLILKVFLLYISCIFSANSFFQECIKPQGLVTQYKFEHSRDILKLIQIAGNIKEKNKLSWEAFVSLKSIYKISNKDLEVKIDCVSLSPISMRGYRYTISLAGASHLIMGNQVLNNLLTSKIEIYSNKLCKDLRKCKSEIYDIDILEVEIDRILSTSTGGISSAGGGSSNSIFDQYREDNFDITIEGL